MNMEASAAVNKRARVTRFLRGAWRHALIDLFLVEIVVAVFFVTRLAVPVRPVRLDAADFPALTIHASSGSWPSQGLTLDTQEEITEYCELFNGLRAPKERHPDRYRIMGGATCSFVFKREGRRGVNHQRDERDAAVFREGNAVRRAAALPRG